MTTKTRPDEERAPRIRGRIRSQVEAHPRTTALLVLAALSLGVFGFLWFRPDKLFVDTTVNEALPTASAPAESGTPKAGAPVGSTVLLSTGSFRNLEHETTGVAKIIRLADGSRIVRLEDFRTSSGPDVVVWLSSIPATEDDWRAYDDGSFVNLGPLRANAGNQNYTIPGTVDISRYRSVVIWCRRFTVGFGAAPIALTT